MVRRREKPVELEGRERETKQSMLTRGAKLLQPHGPLKQFDIYVVGFHCAKEDPHMQMEAHHYCRQVNRDFLQCAIFDGNTKNANLIGIEYIISEPLFEGLPDEERELWHPHNFEILSGQLVAPGLPDAAEKATLKRLMNSYGKTWHTWHTGRYDGKGKAADKLPMGQPTLMWSFNRDGEVDASLAENLEEHMGYDSQKEREKRKELVELAHPQQGVDTLWPAFPDADQEPPPGVRPA